MLPIGEWFRRLHYLLNRRRVDAALKEEMEAHRTLMAEPARFGNSLKLRDEARDVWGWGWLENVMRDLRVATRLLGRSPGFAIVAIASLSLGVVLTTGTIAVANAYLLRALPYGGADRLYHVMYAPPGPWEPRGLASLDWTSVNDVVEFPVTAASETFYLSDGPYAGAARVLRVNRGFVQGLEVRAIAGRTLTDIDFTPASDRVAMIGYALWRDRYGSAPDIVGRTIAAEVEAQSTTRETVRVVGVLPPDFYFGRDSSMGVDLLLPMTIPARTYMVRLRPGVPTRVAEARITDAARHVASDLPADWTGVHLEGVRDRYVADLRPILIGVTLAAAFILLIVCTNIAVLTLLRAMRRQKEMAVRAALGAGRVGCIRLLAFESAIVCTASVVLGLVLTRVTMPLLAPVIGRRLGRPAPGGMTALGLDGTVLFIAAGLAVLMAASLSILPILTPWQARIGDVLRRTRGGATDSRVMRHMRSALVACQVAGTLVLLVGGGLMLKSVIGMAHTDLGFEPDRLVRGRIVLRAADYAEPLAFFRFQEQFAEALTTATGAPVVFASWPPFAERPTMMMESDGQSGSGVQVGAISVGGSYFSTVGTPLRRGRDFTAADVRDDTPVAAVSETLARRLWPDGDAIGRQVREVEPTSDGPRAARWRTVVAVVSDVRQDYFDSQRADLYVPLSPSRAGRYASFTIRTSNTAAIVLQTSRTVATTIDPRSVVDLVSAVTAQNQQLEGARFLTTAMTGVALAAMCLAVLGIYGVMAYSVQNRQREIAIRMAIGATARSISRMFLRDCLSVLGIGAALGLAGTLVLTRVLENRVYGVSSVDASTPAVACTLLMAAGALAGWWPARRASRASPVTALKDD